MALDEQRWALPNDDDFKTGGCLSCCLGILTPERDRCYCTEDCLWLGRDLPRPMETDCPVWEEE